MSYSDEAAEQVVRMTLEGAETAARITGAGAKQIAVLLYSVLHDQKKTKGKTRLTSMLRSGKELKVFAVKDAELQRFSAEAKKYGVLYCILKDKAAGDGITDVMVRAEDASKINRIFERFQLSVVDMGSVKNEIENKRRSGEDMEQPERTAPEQEDDRQAMERLLRPVLAGEKGQTENPTEARTQKSRQSEPTSKPKEPAEKGISEKSGSSRPSVRRELEEIKEEQRQKSEGSRDSIRPAAEKQAEHKTPVTKPAERKER